MSRFVTVLLFAVVALVWPAAARASGPALQYATADSLGVFHVDVDRLRKSPVFKEVQASMLKRPDAKRELDELKKQLGVDPWKDLSGFTVILGPTATKNQRDVVFVLEGKYSEKRVLDFIQKHDKAAPEAVEGKTGKYYRFDGGRMNIAFRGKYVLIGGPIERAMATNDPKAALADVRRPVEKNPVWLAVRTNPDARGQLGMLGASDLETLALGIDVSEGAKVHLHGRFSNPSQAANLATEIRGAIDGASKDKTVQQLGLVELMKSIEVRDVGPDLDLSLSLDKSQAGALIQTLQGLAH
ncbi:MAG: hypothetical protein FJ095_11200 [Deltaproteobacteria bacterium]|nr:hypothetical protein [Deltaproteobacteria bacterium]